MSPECVCEISAQNTPQIIYYKQLENVIFGVCLKKSFLEYMALNANELHISAPSTEEGVAYKSLCNAYLQQ